MDKTICIKRFDQLSEAEYARQILEQNGIKCFLSNTIGSQLYPIFNSDICGIRLNIFEEDEQQATEILNELSSSTMLKLIADKYIPYLDGILDDHFELIQLPPEEITPSAVRDADALLVRTRTLCNEDLLRGSQVSFIGTATIGYDHIDTQYCRQHNISWTNAPGCNAQGVCDYIEAAIDYFLRYASEHNITEPKTIGIIGVGHVGSRVMEMAKRKGFSVLLNDPPLEAEGKHTDWKFSTLETIMREADIITCHTPLTKDGEYKTLNLIGSEQLKQCKPHTLIINAARGGIIDEQALKQHLLSAQHLHAIIDTWVGEPEIDTELLRLSLLSTYHIAGYTRQGKLNATNMCLSALCSHFNLPDIQATDNHPRQQPLPNNWIEQVSDELKDSAFSFEKLRKNYILR